MKNILTFKLTRRIASAAMGVGMLATLIIGSAGTAFADGGDGSVTVNGGSLTETVGAIVINGGSNVTLNGTDQNVTITLPITVNDATGTGAGWHETIQASQFSGAGTNSPNHLPAPVVTGVTATGASGTTFTDPTQNTDPISYTNFSVPTDTAQTVFSADANSGMGRFALSPAMTVKVPANAIPDTYSSTFTVAVVTAP